MTVRTKFFLQFRFGEHRNNKVDVPDASTNNWQAACLYNSRLQRQKPLFHIPPPLQLPQLQILHGQTWAVMSQQGKITSTKGHQAKESQNKFPMKQNSCRRKRGLELKNNKNTLAEISECDPLLNTMPPHFLVSVITIPLITLLTVSSQRSQIFLSKKVNQRGGTVKDFGSEDLVYESLKTFHKKRATSRAKTKSHGSLRHQQQN